MPDETNLSDATVPELKARAAELEIVGASRMKRDDLVTAIAAAESNDIPPGTPAETGRPELSSVAEQRAANRNPRRVGATNN